MAKETLKKLDKRIAKFAKKRIVSRGIVKSNKLTIIIKKEEPHSILGEKNRFFKNVMEQEKRSMFSG